MLLRGRVAEEKSAADQRRKLEFASVDAVLQKRVDAAKKAHKIEVEEAKASAEARTNIETAQAKEGTRLVRDITMLRQRAMYGGGGFGGNGAGGGRRGERDFAYRMGYWASRNFSPVTPMLSYAGRVGGDILRGAGVSFDISQMVGNRVESSKLAADISNAGYLKGDVRNGQRVSNQDLLRDAMNAGNKSAYSQQEALQGLQSFTALSGDLQTGRDILEKMAFYARATGSGLKDMMESAGNVDNILGNIPNKGEVISKIMAGIAGQGKLGAVEVRDMSTQMAKLAAAAPQYAGNVADNVLMMGALAQEARQRGGAASATQAATSVMSFTNTFSKSKRIDAFEGMVFHGKNPGDASMKAWRESLFKDGKFRGPEEIIMSILEGTHGDTKKIGKIVSDSGARRITRGFETIYKEASGGKGTTDAAAHHAGMMAVAAEFDRLRKAAIDDEEAQESHRRAMEEESAKIQLFQNKLQEVTATMADRVLPAFEKLAPHVLDVAQGFASVVAWLADNPFAIIPAMLGAAITKSLTEQAIRIGVENVFRDLMGKAGPGFGGGAGVAGNLSAAFTIASMAVATVMIGEAYIDSWFLSKQKEQKENALAGLETGNEASEIVSQVKEGNAPAGAKVDALEKSIAKDTEKANRLRGGMPTMEKTLLVAAALSEGKNPNVEYQKEMTRREHEAADIQRRTLEVMQRLDSNGIHVKNMAAFAPPNPDSGGTSNSADTKP